MLSNIAKVLERYKKDVFVMYNKDNKDKYFCKYISKVLSTCTIAIITKKKVYIIVNELDKENVNSLKYDVKCVKIFVYKDNNELNDILQKILIELKYPKDIALSYSTISDTETDILTHGEYVILTKTFKEIYAKNNRKVKFSSAENIIYQIASKKTKKQIIRLELIAAITSRILQDVANNISIGNSELDIVYITKDITEKIMKLYVGSNDIVSYTLAWEPCPIVLIGENLQKGGHSIPSNKKLNYGDTIYFDFGIRVTFADGEFLCSDIQRMGYALKPKEKEPPKEIQKVFDTLVNSIEEALDKMKPGVKAYEVDKVVRQYISKNNYPLYNHATGHPVGNQVHDVGAVIATSSSKRANLQLVEDGIYTIEPRIQIPNGGSIEEMIRVTKYGGVSLCDMQKQIYLIR